MEQVSRILITARRDLAARSYFSFDIALLRVPTDKVAALQLPAGDLTLHTLYERTLFLRKLASIGGSFTQSSGDGVPSLGVAYLQLGKNARMAVEPLASGDDTALLICSRLPNAEPVVGQRAADARQSGAVVASTAEPRVPATDDARAAAPTLPPPAQRDSISVKLGQTWVLRQRTVDPSKPYVELLMLTLREIAKK